MRQNVRFSVAAVCSLACVLATSCVQYRHYTQTDPPVSQAGAPPAEPLPMRYRLTHFEVDASSETTLSKALAFGGLGAKQIHWRDNAPADIRRAYSELFRSQRWMGTETPSDTDADFRTVARVEVKEKTSIWIPGVLLYTLAASVGMAGGAGIAMATTDDGFNAGAFLGGAFGGLAVGLIGGSFIPSYRATVHVETRTRLEATARRGGTGGTFYERTQDTHRTELYSGWTGGEDARSAFIGKAVMLNQRQVLDHLREAGPGMLRSLVNAESRGQRPLPRGTEASGLKPLPQGETVRVFVSDVIVDADGLADLGPVLASEIQVALQAGGRFQPLTLENLEAQLRKEKKKALLSCADDGCVQRIIENFGIPDTIFGRVKALGAERLHITLTWTRAGDVLHALTALSDRDPGALLEATRDLATRLAAAVAPMDGES